MSKSVQSATITQFPRTVALECPECGAIGKGTCHCGVPYVPAGERAARAITVNPELSDRAIAEQIGINPMTVGRARKKSTVTPVTVRTGKDGKRRKMPRKKWQATSKTATLSQKTNNLTRGLSNFLEVWCEAASDLYPDLKSEQDCRMSLRDHAASSARVLWEWATNILEDDDRQDRPHKSDADAARDRQKVAPS